MYFNFNLMLKVDLAVPFRTKKRAYHFRRKNSIFLRRQTSTFNDHFAAKPEWSSLVNPEARIPEFIERLTGISNAMVASAPTFAELAGDLAQLRVLNTKRNTLLLWNRHRHVPIDELQAVHATRAAGRDFADDAVGDSVLEAKCTVGAKG